MKATRRRPRRLLAVMCATALLAACYESPDATLHEPGVYKGAEDPLLSAERTAARAPVLRERLQRGQTDR